MVYWKSLERLVFVDKLWYKPLTGVGGPPSSPMKMPHLTRTNWLHLLNFIILQDKLPFFGGAKRCWDLITYMIWLRFLDKNAGWHKLAHLKALTPFVKSFYQQTSKYKTCKKLLKYCWKGRVSSCLRNILYWRLVIPFFSGFDQFDHRPIITRISCIVRIQAIVVIFIIIVFIIIIVIVIIIIVVIIIMVLQANFTMWGLQSSSPWESSQRLSSPSRSL